MDYLKGLKIFIVSILSLLIFLVFSSFTPALDIQTSGEEHVENQWREEISKISIASSKDDTYQDAYFLSSDENAPLIISLHQWSGTYDRFDPLSNAALENNWNYIRPNFRGPNTNPEAGGSILVISDIDDAISYSIDNGHVDPSQIHIIGASGGGHAALMHLMNGSSHVSSYSVWVPIVDLVAWYGESYLRGTGYDEDILAITSSTDSLNISEAQNRSPIYQNTPVDRVKNSEVNIFAGINDGYQGSVPISHSINFYNKLITDLNYSEENLVPSNTKSELVYTQDLTERNQTASLGEREVIYYNSTDNLSLTIFDGHHEILYDEAFRSILTLIED